MESTLNFATIPGHDVNDDHRPLLKTTAEASMSVTPSNMSPTGTSGSPARVGGSADSGRKIRSITPKILALKAMFENRSSSGTSSGSCSNSVTPTSPEPVIRVKASHVAPIQNNAQSRDGDSTSFISLTAQSSSTTAASIVDYLSVIAFSHHDVRLSTDGVAYPEAPTPTPRQPNILTRIASRAELALKRKASSRSAVNSVVLAVGGEPAAIRSWREKADALAAWAARCRDEGYGVELDCEALCTLTDVVERTTVSRERERAGAATPLPVIHSEETLRGGGLLSPEEDLAECVGSSGSGAHLTAYFALVLSEVSLPLDGPQS